jgi:hypothetical protein
MDYGYPEYEAIKRLFIKYGYPIGFKEYENFIKELAVILKV